MSARVYLNTGDSTITIVNVLYAGLPNTFSICGRLYICSIIGVAYIYDVPSITGYPLLRYVHRVYDNGRNYVLYRTNAFTLHNVVGW